MVEIIRISQEAPNIHIWRFFVLERDDYTCQKCGFQSKKTRDVIAHHKSADPNLRLTVANGISLCRGCHTTLHYDLFEQEHGIRKVMPSGYHRHGKRTA